MPGGYANLRFEQIDLNYLGLDPTNPIATDFMALCAALIGRIAIHENEVNLVLTGDFDESVQGRLPEDSDEFGSARGTGLVGGKTMQRDDGTIDVLLRAQMFEEGLEPEDLKARRTLAARTSIHEAGHVAIIQSGEEWVDPGGESPLAARSFIGIAASVIDEYRAELLARGAGDIVAFGLTDVGNQDWDLLHALADYASRLRSANSAYQASRDVFQLHWRVGTDTAMLWRLLAYFAANLRVTSDELDDGLASAQLWRRVAASHWARFTELLGELSSSAVRIEQDVLSRVRGELADHLYDWLRHIGFDFRDVGGQARFEILEWDLIT